MVSRVQGQRLETNIPSVLGMNAWGDVGTACCPRFLLQFYSASCLEVLAQLFFLQEGGASCPSYFHVCCTWSMLWPTQLSWFISFEIRIIAPLACSALCVNMVLSSRPRPKTRSGCSSWSLRCWCCILVVRLTLRQRDLMRFAV